MIDKILKDIKGLFKVQDKAKFIKQNIPYLAFFYIGNIFSHHIRSYVGGDLLDKIFQGILEIDTMSFIPSIQPTDILAGIVIAAIIKLVVYTKSKNAKKFRQGKEYGSARWGAYYLLKELLYGRKRRKRHDRIQQDHRAILPSFSR